MINCIKRSLLQLEPFLPQSTPHCIDNSLVQPHFDFFNIVWGNCGNKTLSNKLQKRQNHAVRVMTSSGCDADVDCLFHKLGWKDLSNSESRPGWVSTLQAVWFPNILLLNQL